MGISDLCLGAPRYCYSTQDYNEACRSREHVEPSPPKKEEEQPQTAEPLFRCTQCRMEYTSEGFNVDRHGRRRKGCKACSERNRLYRLNRCEHGEYNRNNCRGCIHEMLARHEDAKRAKSLQLTNKELDAILAPIYAEMGPQKPLMYVLQVGVAVGGSPEEGPDAFEAYIGDREGTLSEVYQDYHRFRPRKAFGPVLFIRGVLLKCVSSPGDSIAISCDGKPRDEDLKALGEPLNSIPVRAHTDWMMRVYS